MTSACLPRPGVVGLALLLAGAVLLSAGTASALIRGSALALPLMSGQVRPQFYLAQRAIERSWGLSEDSTYIEVDAPEWRSEGLAAGMSLLVPGTGQLYAGAGSGWWFLLAEAAGWTAHSIYVSKAHTARDDADQYAGDPNNPASAWSFERYREATGLDPAQLEAIWAADRRAFYELIEISPAYLAGWSGDPQATHDAYAGMRGTAEGYYDRAEVVGYALLINHLVAAVDALRAARLRNLVIQKNLELKLRSSWERGRPAVVAALVRRF